MSHEEDIYKLCIIEKPFLNNSEKKFKSFFGHLLSLRMEGYSAVHGIDVIPIDKYDYFAINFFLYKELEGDIIPLACSRIIRYSECIANDMEFTPLSLLHSMKNNNTKQGIQQLISDRVANGQDITFDSSFTISPELKGSVESQRVIKYVIGSVLNWHKDNDENCFIASATLKVKTDRLFSKLGLAAISDDSNYNLQNVNNEPALMMKFTESPTQQAHRWMDDSRSLWENREQCV